MSPKVALSRRDRFAERANDADWLLWVDRADGVEWPFGFPVSERQGYIRGGYIRGDIL